ncbi:MarR family winged helix-turn-helix transcriptional regulator [Actinomadura scrupuli]|uniref:MarR family winged helix-turn-helix transcriptional regulator n=1 Tax=Actinomadura scrupuli TaxID=559629 RepID=UPI003D98AC1A
MTDHETVLEPALTGYTGYLLFRAFLRAEACGLAAMPAGRHPRDLAILSALVESGPVSQARLGELLKINRTIMVKLVDGLEQAGLVRRERDPADRRCYALALTAEGRAARDAMHRAAAGGEDALTAGLTPAEHRRLNELLRPLVPDLTGALPESITSRSGFLIARSHVALRQRAAHALRALGIEPRHFGTLTALAAAEPCSQQRLAARLGVSGPAIVQTVDDLHTAGLIVRDRNPADRREHVLRLTASGRAHLDRARDTLDGIQREVAALLGPSAAGELNALLIKLVTP